MVSNAFKRQEDAGPLQGDQVRGGEHHVQPQNVFVEVTQRSGVWTIDRDCTTN
jgi:hypothetical protein